MEENILLHGELSYKILGIIFDVHNELGGEKKEKYYQRALEKAFEKAKISYKSQLKIPIYYKEDSIGCYRPDFIIDKKIVLEIKRGFGFTQNHLKQIKEYLEKTGFELGILAVFSKNKVIHTRVLNLY